MKNGHPERSALRGALGHGLTSKQSPKSMCRIFPLSRSSIRLDGCLRNRRETTEGSLARHWWINRQGCGSPGPAHRPKPAPTCLWNTAFLDSALPICHVRSQAAFTPQADMSSYEISHGQQSPNYFLSGPLQRKFADPCSRSARKIDQREWQAAFLRSLVTRRTLPGGAGILEWRGSIFTPQHPIRDPISWAPRPI